MNNLYYPLFHFFSLNNLTRRFFLFDSDIFYYSLEIFIFLYYIVFLPTNTKIFCNKIAPEVIFVYITFCRFYLLSFFMHFALHYFFGTFTKKAISFSGYSFIINYIIYFLRIISDLKVIKYINIYLIFFELSKYQSLFINYQQ